MSKYSKKKEKLIRKYSNIFFVIYLVLNTAIIVIWHLPKIPSFMLISVSVITSYFVFRLDELYDNYRKGDIGEALVERELSKINSITAFHDICLPRINNNFDSVVVSKKGIYLIETKNYDGQLSSKGGTWKRKLNGQTYTLKDFTKQTKGNAAELKNFINNKLHTTDTEKLYIEPIIVLIQPFEHKDMQTDIKVISLDQLAEYVTQGTKNYSDEFINNVINLLSDIKSNN